MGEGDISFNRRMSATNYLDKTAISPTTFETQVGTPSPTKNQIAFGFNRKILNPYIIFQKNQTTVIDGTQPLFSVLNKKLGKTSLGGGGGTPGGGAPLLAQ
jgi:hypothetical protein